MSKHEPIYDWVRKHGEGAKMSSHDHRNCYHLSLTYSCGEPRYVTDAERAEWLEVDTDFTAKAMRRALVTIGALLDGIDRHKGSDPEKAMTALLRLADQVRR